MGLKKDWAWSVWWEVRGIEVLAVQCQFSPVGGSTDVGQVDRVQGWLDQELCGSGDGGRQIGGN